MIKSFFQLTLFTKILKSRQLYFYKPKMFIYHSQYFTEQRFSDFLNKIFIFFCLTLYVEGKSVFTGNR